jgi:hypothetical protein
MRMAILACVLLVAASGAPHARQQDFFEFHSAFWINLHHYLHALARPAGALPNEIPVNATAGERQQWTGAVDFYTAQFGKRSLLFDEKLVGIKQALTAAGSSDRLPETTLAPDHRAALDAAAPIYRKHWWTDHDAANRRFIDALQPLLKQHGGPIASRLAASFDAAWPSAPMRVDLVHDAGPPGNAYTISEPTLITIGAGDSRHQGLAALELVFHEASHRWDAVLMKDVEDVARDLERRAPPGLWHGLLFYNAGVITTDALVTAGVSDYEMYMSAQRTFDFPGWHQAIARHWPLYLAGSISRREATSRIVRELAAGPAAAAKVFGFEFELGGLAVSNLEWRLHHRTELSHAPNHRAYDRARHCDSLNLGSVADRHSRLSVATKRDRRHPRRAAAADN